jgi:hypothetical protein
MSNKNNSNILFPNKNNHAKKFMRFSLKFWKTKSEYFSLIIIVIKKLI